LAKVFALVEIRLDVDIVRWSRLAKIVLWLMSRPSSYLLPDPL